MNGTKSRNSTRKCEHQRETGRGGRNGCRTQTLSRMKGKYDSEKEKEEKENEEKEKEEEDQKGKEEDTGKEEETIKSQFNGLD